MKKNALLQQKVELRNEAIDVAKRRAHEVDELIDQLKIEPVITSIKELNTQVNKIQGFSIPVSLQSAEIKSLVKNRCKFVHFYINRVSQFFSLTKEPQSLTINSFSNCLKLSRKILLRGLHLPLLLVINRYLFSLINLHGYVELRLNTGLMLMEKRNGSWDMLKGTNKMSLPFYMIPKNYVNLLPWKLRKIIIMEIFGSYDFTNTLLFVCLTFMVLFSYFCNYCFHLYFVCLLLPFHYYSPSNLHHIKY